MTMTLGDKTPVLDMDVSVNFKVRDLIKLNQILARTYDEEDRLRETIGPILQEIKTTVSKIETNQEWLNLKQWNPSIDLLDKAASKQQKHLKKIKNVLIKSKNLRIGYCVPGSGEITKRTIIPLELWESDGYWLLRAYCYLKGEEHTFRLDRILKAKEKAPDKKKDHSFVKRSDDFIVETEPALEQEIRDDFEDQWDSDGAEESDSEIGSIEEEPAAELSKNSVTSDEELLSVPKHRHYSLPGKKPHLHGLPNRLERLIKRVDRNAP